MPNFDVYMLSSGQFTAMQLLLERSYACSMPEVNKKALASLIKAEYVRYDHDDGTWIVTNQGMACFIHTYIHQWQYDMAFIHSMLANYQKLLDSL